jgi:hypothetical protein
VVAIASARGRIRQRPPRAVVLWLRHRGSRNRLVLVRTAMGLRTDAFLDSSSGHFGPYGLRIQLRDSASGFSCLPPEALARHFQSPVGFSNCVTPSLTPHHWYRNINRSSIDYALRPRLRVRLTLGGFTVPRKPEAYGDGASHTVYRYSCPDHHFDIVQQSLRSAFYLSSNAPLPKKPGSTGSISRLRHYA